MTDREDKLLQAALDLVQERLNAGVVSSEEVVDFLKLGSSRDRLDSALPTHDCQRHGLSPASGVTPGVVRVCTVCGKAWYRPGRGYVVPTEARWSPLGKDQLA